MITAMPVTNNSTLELFKLALTMIQSQEHDIPKTLTDYFIEILTQTTSIIHNSHNVSPDIMPEAIELAVDFSNDEELLKILDDLNSIEKMTPDVASQLLNKMETPPVCQNGFSSFTGITG